jgi:hypothetical protein
VRLTIPRSRLTARPPLCNVATASSGLAPMQLTTALLRGYLKGSVEGGGTLKAAALQRSCHFQAATTTPKRQDTGSPSIARSHPRPPQRSAAQRSELRMRQCVPNHRRPRRRCGLRHGVVAGRQRRSSVRFTPTSFPQSHQSTLYHQCLEDMPPGHLWFHPPPGFYTPELRPNHHNRTHRTCNNVRRYFQRRRAGAFRRDHAPKCRHTRPACVFSSRVSTGISRCPFSLDRRRVADGSSSPAFTPRFLTSFPSNVS